MHTSFASRRENIQSHDSGLGNSLLFCTRNDYRDSKWSDSLAAEESDSYTNYVDSELQLQAMRAVEESEAENVQRRKQCTVRNLSQ